MAYGTLSNIKVDPVAGYFSAKFTADATVAACSVFCGFTPRIIKMSQLLGTPTTACASVAFESNTSGTNGVFTTLVHGTGATTITTANGFTFLSGTEALPTSIAVNSPSTTGGPGFIIGTAVHGSTQVYLIEAIR